MNCLTRVGAAMCLLTASMSTSADCTIYVSHNGDADAPFWSLVGGSDNQVLLREAAEIGYGVARCYTSFEKDRIVGGNFVNDAVACGTFDNSRNWRLSVSNPGCGPNNADTVRFWDNIGGGANIGLAKRLIVDPRDSIDGAPSVAGARAKIALVGPGPGGSNINSGAIVFDNFSTVPASGSIRNLVVDNFRLLGIWAQRVDGLSIKGVTVSRISASESGFSFGLALGELVGPAFGNNCVFNAQIGGTGVGEQNHFYGIGYHAIRIWDSCSGNGTDRNNKIYNNYIGICEELDTGPGLDGCPGGTPNQGIGQSGVFIHETPNTRLGGSGSNERNFITRSGAAGVYLSGTRNRDTRVLNNWIGLSRTGFGRANSVGVLLTAGAFQNQIGSANNGEGNVISANTQHAVRIQAGDANVVSGNIIGLNSARTLALGNGQDGVAINAGATNAMVSNNIIGYSGGWGVYIDGGSGHSISANVIGLRGGVNNSNDNTAAANAGGIWVNNVPGVDIVGGNRISSNTGYGIYINGDNADGTTVRGNVIGLSNGNDRRPNSVGILVESGADDTVIGGASAADRNTISGNTYEGVRIKDIGSERSIVRGNYVGSTPDGLGAAHNASRGVRIDSGASASEVIGNLISGNHWDGVALISAGSPTKVQGNVIGLSASGMAMPNSASGIAIVGATTGALIGDVSAPNTIAANGSFGVYLAESGTNGNTIAGNYVGVASAGLANAAGGITLRADAASNVVSANVVIGHSGGPGIEIIGAHNNTLRANRVGLTTAGSSFGNQAGVRVVGGATGNVIGGAVADRNYISGNALYGLSLAEAGTDNNSALNNYIGVDVVGTSARANGIGVLIESGAANNTLTQNLISGNSSEGVLIQGAGSDGNRLQRNRIGLAATGTAIIANASHGIRITGNALGTLTGGLPLQANFISGNGGAGVRVESGEGHDISFNSIVRNAGVGIDLGPLGITPNDAMDADTGANALQNFATLSNVVQSGAMASMTITQNGLASTQHAVLVYANAACDSSGQGEGETFLDALSVTTNGSGNGSINAMLPLPSSTPVPVFTATSNVSAGNGENTSEFSPCALNGSYQVNVFASGFETPAQILAHSKALTAEFEHDGIRRVGQNHAILDLVFENTIDTSQSARSLSILSDRAVGIESIHTEGLACALFGAIVCELPALIPGQRATLRVHLQAGPDAATMTVIDADAAAGNRRSFTLLPY